MITISIDTKDLEKKMSDYPARLAAAQKRALQYIGAAVQSRATQAFRSEACRPSKWAPRKSGGTHPLLIMSGSLRKSISWKLQGDDTVVVGTPYKYGSYHQNGTRHMPARPFLPVYETGELMQDLLAKLKRNISRIYVEELEGLKG